MLVEGVVVLWLGLQFNKSLPVCVENSVFGVGGGGDWNRASGEALEISQSRAGMLVTWPSVGCGEGEKRMHLTCILM